MDERFNSFFDELSNVRNKDRCFKCGKSRRYFCYDCEIFMPGVSPHVPKEVPLPVEVHILKHPAEHNSKSTGVHASLMAPSSVYLYSLTDTDIPNYTAESEEYGDVALVFPSKNAVPLKEFVSENCTRLKRLIFLDSTWNTVGSLRNMKQISKIPCVKLSGYTTEYWRPQKGINDEALATIEAIRHAVVEVQTARFPQSPYRGEFDFLLFWFYFFKRQFIDSSNGLKRIPNNNGVGQRAKQELP